MTEFAIGQRWLSETETELGLGIIQSTDYRLVTLFFPAVEEERTYAKEGAPLSRINFRPGDALETVEGIRLFVLDSEEIDGILYYKTAHADAPDEHFVIPETQLGHHIELHDAEDRLFSKQFDNPRWFELRYQAALAREVNQLSPVKGLSGVRTDLIPHQLYIANQVASRYAPRVLLADEVGLGKTIEAGMIIHQQLLTGRCSRVLVVVPPALVNQWFVEMIRRFNLHFHMFNENRYLSLKSQNVELDDEFSGFDLSEEEDHNPFLSEQLILCDTDFLEHCNIDELANAHWDMVVVDEAHHLEWSETEASENYLRVEQLANNSKGLLLLTATPEQLGRESHFARLRLLDPDRFHSLQAFIDEQKQYQPVADLACRLNDESPWATDLITAAQALLPDIKLEEANRNRVVRELLDRNGTGRVLFRNTRKNISGFPHRKVHEIALPFPESFGSDFGDRLENLLYPETLFNDDSWCHYDNRLDWLYHFLKQNPQEKVLVICAQQATAIDLNAYLNYKKGLNTSVFHEGMDIISRDRAAAWFADSEEGAQALICSEIGSEGRNFQFARHLVLFDLPLNPDLLEQRIGRLDRIGQKHDIQIHVPHYQQHPQAVLFNWYHAGMNAFEATNPAGEHIYKQCREALIGALQNPADQTRQDALINETRVATSQIRHKLETGRDRLLELSSYNEEEAQALVRLIQDSDTHPPQAFMESAFDLFGVDTEEHSEHCTVVRPGDHMYGHEFPSLPEDGITVTYDRAVALSRDDMHFLTWEHPMVTGTIDMVLSEDKGKASVCVLKSKGIKPGTLLMETFFVVDCPAPAYLQLQRFLPNHVLRSLMDTSGKDIASAIDHHKLSSICHKLEKAVARKILDSQQSIVHKMLQLNRQVINKKFELIKEQATAKLKSELKQERDRLLALREKNPNIREEEIRFIEIQAEALRDLISQSKCQLEGVRIIVAS
ncbi:MAG: RNA polymerase-associated protein RapA [Pseudomonadales bacterium]|nr:RNA polymerase-associated protein RapA [Pseudomonadales bacterium]